MVEGFFVVMLGALALLAFGVGVDRVCLWRAERKSRHEDERAADKH